jgi:orotate phosphoribosyltransferase
MKEELNITMLNEEELLKTLRDCGALLDGHFLLSSGLHSNRYVQCAKVTQYPDVATRLCAQLADNYQDLKVDVVVGPAMGGILVAQEMGRALQVRALFTERENGRMTLRRGFELRPGERVLVTEDVVTTGLSTKEVLTVLQEFGAEVVGCAALIDRHTSEPNFGVPFHALLRLEIATYQPDNCPLCREGLPLVKPGSRKKPA